MGANSEDYLDSLLSSLSKEKEERPSYPNLFRSAEEDFLRDFEKEILADEDLDYLKEFEQELGVGSSSGLHSEPAADHQEKPAKQREESAVERQLRQLEEEAAKQPVRRKEENPLDADDIISGLKNRMGNAASKEPVLDESKIEEFTLTEEKPAPVLMPEGKAELDGEPDLSGQADSGLLDLLKGNEDFSELGNMLGDSFEVNTLDSSEEIDAFMQKEMKEQAAQSSENAEEEDAKDAKKKGSKKKKDKKNKKESSEKGNGFFAKLSAALFGSDEEEDEKKITITAANLDENLSDENMQILAELEAAEKQEEPDKKKKKEKKAKKEKPKKEKAPKPKKEKAPKPKKEKPPKEKDNTPPLPRVPVILIVVMVASLAGLVLLGASALSYQPNLQEAKSQYASKNYEESNQCLQGLKIKEKDEQFYQQTCIMSAISSEYHAYQTFLSHDMQDLALDSLICALGRCEINRKAAETYECIPELENLEQEIINVLGTQYNISAEQALETYNMRDRDKYTQQLYQYLRELGLMQY